MLCESVVQGREIIPWSFPIVVVKKDGGHTFCVDFRMLNIITRPIAVPLPLIDDILVLLSKSVSWTEWTMRRQHLPVTWGSSILW